MSNGVNEELAEDLLMALKKSRERGDTAQEAVNSLLLFATELAKITYAGEKGYKQYLINTINSIIEYVEERHK